MRYAIKQVWKNLTGWAGFQYPEHGYVEEPLFDGKSGYDGPGIYSHLLSVVGDARTVPMQRGEHLPWLLLRVPDAGPCAVDFDGTCKSMYADVCHVGSLQAVLEAYRYRTGQSVQVTKAASSVGPKIFCGMRVPAQDVPALFEPVPMAEVRETYDNGELLSGGAFESKPEVHGYIYAHNASGTPADSGSYVRLIKEPTRPGRWDNVTVFNPTWQHEARLAELKRRYP